MELTYVARIQIIAYLYLILYSLDLFSILFSISWNFFWILLRRTVTRSESYKFFMCVGYFVAKSRETSHSGRWKINFAFVRKQPVNFNRKQLHTLHYFATLKRNIFSVPGFSTLFSISPRLRNGWIIYLYHWPIAETFYNNYSFFSFLYCFPCNSF